MYDPANGKLVRTIFGRGEGSIAVSPKGTLVARGTENGNIIIWKIESGEISRTLPRSFNPVRSVAISPDRKFVAGGLTNGTFIIWNLAKLKNPKN